MACICFGKMHVTRSEAMTLACDIACTMLERKHFDIKHLQ